MFTKTAKEVRKKERKEGRNTSKDLLMANCKLENYSVIEWHFLANRSQIQVFLWLKELWLIGL